MSLGLRNYPGIRIVQIRKSGTHLYRVACSPVLDDLVGDGGADSPVLDDLVGDGQHIDSPVLDLVGDDGADSPVLDDLVGDGQHVDGVVDVAEQCDLRCL